MKFLVFQHVPHEHPGLISDFAKAKNITLQVVEFWKTNLIPSLKNFDALVIMGGPMGVYEDAKVFPSRDNELKVIREAVSKNIPTIGFCLGSQLIAKALGSKVYPNIRDGKKVKEIGYFSVNLTINGQADPIFAGFNSTVKVLQWHGDAFDLPEKSQLLATSPACTNQAFKFGNTYGMLFHNEFTPEMVSIQVEKDNKWIHEAYPINEKKLISEAQEYQHLMKKQCNQLFNNFLTVIKAG